MDGEALLTLTFTVGNFAAQAAAYVGPGLQALDSLQSRLLAVFLIVSLAAQGFLYAMVASQREGPRRAQLRSLEAAFRPAAFGLLTVFLLHLTLATLAELSP